MRSVFADTFYFIALLSPSDQAHQKAVEFSDSYDGQIITTDWIITELADGMAPPVSRQKFVSFLDMLRADSDVFIAPLDNDLQEEGLELYRKRPDKGWSLTDCISFVVMQRVGIALGFCAITFGIAAQECEDRTLLPWDQMRAVINETSSERAMHHALELVPYPRVRPRAEYEGHFRESQVMAAFAKEYGFSSVEIESFPSQSRLWQPT